MDREKDSPDTPPPSRSLKGKSRRFGTIFYVVISLFIAWRLADGYGYRRAIQARWFYPDLPSALMDAEAGPAPRAPTDYDAILRAASDDDQRFAIYKRRWADVKHSVSRITLMGALNFNRSFPAFGSKSPSHKVDYQAWPPSDQSEPIVLKENQGLVIAGDCLLPIELPLGGYAHILGDVHGTIIVRDSSDIVIGGDIGPGGMIIAYDSVNIYVGGDLEGEILCHSYADIWIGGDLLGRLQGGLVSTLVIGGNYEGQITGLGEPGILHMIVKGYASGDQLLEMEKTRDEFPEFDVSVGASDLKRGMHIRGKPSGHVWTVHRGPLSREEYEAQKLERQKTRALTNISAGPDVIVMSRD